MKILTLKEMLPIATKNKYGIGAFSPRNTYLIKSVLEAAQNKKSPVIVQISANELKWFSLSAKAFADRFYELVDDFDIPAVLHLDHTKDIETIREAIEAGFTSVMIDSSHLEFEENIAYTKRVVEMAKEFGVSVEAELGRIKTTDKLETDQDSLLYTEPNEAKEFVERTGVDALAISIGTAHGVYPTKNPKIDIERLKQIRQKTSIPLVLHGGSGLQSKTIQQAILLESGGVSKINVATDLEVAFLEVLKIPRVSNDEILRQDKEKLDLAADAVRKLVEDRMVNYMMSNNKDKDFEGTPAFK